MSRIKTSVIIPVYNTAEYLEECVESVLAQTQKDIEIILVDDGSDDGSYEMAQSYAERYPFITTLRQEHMYQGTARNRGLRAAKGEYVYFMDSDDAILPGLFDACYETCENRDLDFVMFEAKGFRYDENDRELEVPDDIVDRRGMGIEDRIYTGPEFWNSFYNCHGVLYVCWLLYIRRSFLLENDLFYEERTYFEDNDWMLRMYLKGERTYFIPEIYHRHRWRRGSNMLDGFTTGLMEGCFRMHDVLLRLHREYEGDEARLKMIEDVIYLNIRRFDRLSEITPGDEYLVPLTGFCLKLEEELKKAASLENEFEHYVHLAVALRIIKSAASWKDKSFYSRFRNMASEEALFNIPETGGKIAVYGTGKVGRYYASALNHLFKECRDEGCGKGIFFVDTYKEDGEFEGFPLYNSRRLPELAPSCAVIASTKYTDEMEVEIRKMCGGDISVTVLPGEIKFLV